MENSERLGRRARPGFEPGTSHLLLLIITTLPLVGRLCDLKNNNIFMFFTITLQLLTHSQK